MSTDISTPAFDPGDFLQRWMEYERRAADLHPANKASLFAALRDAGITAVIVTFDGYGDSGQIDFLDPKAAKITHVRAQLFMRGFAGSTGATANDRVYNPLPLYHSTGGLCGLGAALLNGGSVVLK